MILPPIAIRDSSPITTLAPMLAEAEIKEWPLMSVWCPILELSARITLSSIFACVLMTVPA